jgi:hypothetical protein
LIIIIIIIKTESINFQEMVQKFEQSNTNNQNAIAGTNKRATVRVVEDDNEQTEQTNNKSSCC